MKKVFIIFCCCLCLKMQSQNANINPIDSLLRLLPTYKNDSTKVNLLNTIARNYQYVNGIKAVEFSNKAILLSEKINWKEGEARSFLTLGSSQYSLLKYNEAKIAFDKALNRTDNLQTKSTIYQSIALLNSSQSLYTESISYYFKALNISETLNNKPLTAKIYTNIGTDYSRMLNYDKALEYYFKALKIHEDLNNKRGISLLCQNIGNFYSIKQQEDKAIVYLTRSMAINDDIGNTRGKVYNLESLAGIYLQKFDLNKAIETALQAIKLAENIKDEESVSYIAILIGDIYIEKARIEKNNTLKNNFLSNTEFYYKKGLDIHNRMSALQDIALDYEKLSSVQTLKQNYKDALENYKLSVTYKDSVFNYENKETIKNLEDKREIELRDKQLELNTLTIESNKKQKIYLIIGLILVLIICSLLYYQNKIRRNTNVILKALNLKLEQSNRIKTQFISILNHDLRSPITNTLHFLNLINDSPELLDKKSKNRILEKNISNTKMLLATMDDILLWSKEQMLNFGPKPRDISLDTLFLSMKTLFLNNEKITFIFENPENIQITTDEDYLKTIMRNLTENAIKSVSNTSNPKIIWKGYALNNNTYISITDNGFGNSIESFNTLYNEEEVSTLKTGFGLHLIRDLSKAIQCKITVNSLINQGTTITLQF